MHFLNPHTYFLIQRFPNCRIYVLNVTPRQMKPNKCVHPSLNCQMCKLECTTSLTTSFMVASYKRSLEIPSAVLTVLFLPLVISSPTLLCLGLCLFYIFLHCVCRGLFLASLLSASASFARSRPPRFPFWLNTLFVCSASSPPFSLPLPVAAPTSLGAIAGLSEVSQLHNP